MQKLMIVVFVLAGSIGSRCEAVPKTVFEGKNEIVYLDSWGSPSRWHTAECTVSASSDRLARGRPTLHVHVPVDYYAGEKKYPIGWPRTWMQTSDPWEKDWTTFEHFEFMVYTRMSREKLPKTPITLIVYCPDRSRSWSRRLRELKLNAWVSFSLPISKMRYVDGVASVKFSVSESSYRHGDQLDFYIGGFRFVRSLECRLNTMRIKNAVVFQGQPTLDVEVDVLGVPKGISRAVPFTIRRGDTVIRRESLPVRRGSYAMAIDISELKLAPGTYTLAAFEGEKDKEKVGTFRVVGSPWKEK